MWDDVEYIKPKLEGVEYDTMAINYMIMYWPEELTYGVSWHSDLMKDLVDIRTWRKHKNKPITYAPKPLEGVNVAIKPKEDVITSGMYAPYIGLLHLGYDKIILAGVPFDNSGHFYDRLPTNYGDKIKDTVASQGWTKLNEKAEGKIKAISGNLVRYFGELTDEWISN